MEHPHSHPGGWGQLLGAHRSPHDVARLAPLFGNAGISVDDLKAVLADPTPLLTYPDTDTLRWPWLTNPAAVALAAAEVAAQAAHTQRMFTDVRAAAVSHAVADSTVRAVADQLGIRPQMVSRLHSRGASLFDIAAAIIRAPRTPATVRPTSDGDD